MPYRVVKEALEKNQWREYYIVNNFFLGCRTGTNSQSSTSIVLPWIQNKLVNNLCISAISTKDKIGIGYTLILFKMTSKIERPQQRRSLKKQLCKKIKREEKITL